jgi:hypothetical protein
MQSRRLVFPVLFPFPLTLSALPPEAHISSTNQSVRRTTLNTSATVISLIRATRTLHSG